MCWKVARFQWAEDHENRVNSLRRLCSASAARNRIEQRPSAFPYEFHVYLDGEYGRPGRQFPIANSGNADAERSGLEPRAADGRQAQ